MTGCCDEPESPVPRGLPGRTASENGEGTLESLPSSHRHYATFRNLFLCAFYIANSVALINFNKAMMKRMPHAMVLTGCHMFASSLSSLILYLWVPELFPSMDQAKIRVNELWMCFISLGFLFSISLLASNQAYLYCNVAFLQFMKESNIVWVFLISCAVGLQFMDRLRAAIVLWIVLGSSMCVNGELHFVWIGFLMQGISQLAESCKNVLGEWLMNGNSIKLDPLTYIFFMAPATLVFQLFGIALTWTPDIAHALIENWHYLLPSTMLAVTLNITIAQVLKHCSAMGFMVAGVVKDILIVIVATYVMGEKIMRLQAVGFVVALIGCATWSVVKVKPDAVYVSMLKKILCLPVSDGSETLPIAAKSSLRKLST